MRNMSRSALRMQPSKRESPVHDLQSRTGLDGGHKAHAIWALGQKLNGSAVAGSKRLPPSCLCRRTVGLAPDVRDVGDARSDRTASE